MADTRGPRAPHARALLAAQRPATGEPLARHRVGALVRALLLGLAAVAATADAAEPTSALRHGVAAPWSGGPSPAAAHRVAAPASGSASGAPGVAQPGDTAGRTCAGFPRVDLATPPGTCVARVADARDGLRMPRRLLEVAPNRFWVVDTGSWEPNQGRLLELRIEQAGAGAGRAQTRVLLDRLDRPLGIAGAPDGRVYVAEASRVWRVAPGAALRPEVVIDGLPADGAHPLKEVVFAGPGRLFIGVGSATDACRDPAGRQPLPCPEARGERPRAAVYEAQLAGPRQQLHSLRPFATGLRNSLALAWVADTRTLLQGENSIDYPDAGQPPDELNVLRDGQDYGWPACVGARRPARGYAKARCARTAAPLRLWPAHVAPLHAVALPAADRSPFADQLLVAWHGHRAAGHRVVGFRLDASGLPSGPPIDWLREPSGTRAGTFAPAGLAVAGSGALLVADDRNRRILMLVRER